MYSKWVKYLIRYISKNSEIAKNLKTFQWIPAIIRKMQIIKCLYLNMHQEK